MTQGVRSAITLSVLVLLLVVGTLWGWSAATSPLPAKVDTAVCEQRTVTAGDKVFPPDVTVSGYNAGTREGLAGRIMAELTDQGFAEASSGNATNADVDVAEIWTPDPESPAVLLVASRLGDDVEVVERAGLGPGVTVVIGDDFTAVVDGKRSVTASDDAQICSPPIR